MKNLLSIIALFVCLSANGQERIDNRLKSLDGIVETLYAVISGDKGEARDWDLFRSLFKPDAKLIPIAQSSDGNLDLTYMSVDQYIETAGDYLENNGFHEVEIHRLTEEYNNMCHIYSTYESYHNSTDEKPFIRGINSIQLLFDNNRWWVVNIYWTNESMNNPIPDKYLPE